MNHARPTRLTPFRQLLLACLLFSPALFAQVKKTAPDLNSITDSAIQDAGHLRPGMTRADVEKNFKKVSGRQKVSPSVYSWQRLTIVKVDVVYKGDGTASGDPGDVIVSVSRPYLGDSGVAPPTLDSGNLYNVINSALHDARALHPGMRRADVDKTFEAGGGIYGQTRFYDWKRCQMIHIEVAYKFQKKGIEPEGNPDDIILSVSRPYLGYPTYD